MENCNEKRITMNDYKILFYVSYFSQENMILKTKNVYSSIIQSFPHLINLNFSFFCLYTLILETPFPLRTGKSL